MRNCNEKMSEKWEDNKEVHEGGGVKGGGEGGGGREGRVNGGERLGGK